MNKIPIFIPSDDNYVAFAATTMASILYNTKSFINFYILDGGIKDENKEKIESLKDKFNNFTVEFLKIDLEKEFSNFKALEYLNVSTYMRMLIPKLKPELNKILYIDSDAIALKDVAKIYNTDLEGYPLGAVWDETRISYNLFDPVMPSDKCRYFNVGVLLIDCKQWCEKNIVEELFKVEKEIREKSLHADETVLNKYFAGNFKALPVVYNFLYHDFLYSPDKINDIVIRHYCGPEKPWHFYDNDSVMENTTDFWKYAEMTPFFNYIYETHYNVEKNSQRVMRYRVLKFAAKKRMEILKKTKEFNVCSIEKIQK